MTFACLGKYLGIGQPVGEIGTKNLNDFLDWLLNERGVPCSPKSYARRVTTLKVFFGWLHESGVLTNDPPRPSSSAPSPALCLSLPAPIRSTMRCCQTQAMRVGVNVKKPDARPYLLLTLLLKTGVKKSEAMNIVPNHIDRSEPDRRCSSFAMPILAYVTKNESYI